MTSQIARLPSTRLLERLIQSPDLVRGVQALSPVHFAALIRRIGVADAGELVALATSEQLTQAFDEDLFRADEPGERERLDVERFATWLEVLLEAGDRNAARRLRELSEDFVLHALLASIVVLDDESLRERMDFADDQAELTDKVLESSLSEQLDGYLLLGRGEPGWDAWLSVILAWDRDDRHFLERVLDRAAAACTHYLEDLDELCEALTAAESLAEDVEAAREERRAAQGYVEARAAAAFLLLAGRPLTTPLSEVSRDANTKAYFRGLPESLRTQPFGAGQVLPADDASALKGSGLELLVDVEPQSGAPDARAVVASDRDHVPLEAALEALAQVEPERFSQRMEELAYLANVLVAGASSGAGRLSPMEAASAALASVALGALLESSLRPGAKPLHQDLLPPLRSFPADLLFRRAAAALVASGVCPPERPFLGSRAEVGQAWRRIAG